MILVFLDLISISNDANTGGHLAHLAGAFFGYIYVSQMRAQGRDWSIPVNRTLDQISAFFKNLFRPSTKPKVVYRNKDKMKNASATRKREEPVSASHQEKLDEILDKIKQRGYESLDADEKEFLFNASKK